MPAVVTSTACDLDAHALSNRGDEQILGWAFRPLQRALSRVFADPRRRPLLDRLRLRSVGPADLAAFARLLDYEREAVALGYGEIA